MNTLRCVNTPKPVPLRPGDTLALIAPGSPPKDADALEQGIAHLKARGYRVVRRRSYVPCGYLAGPDADRLDELNGFLRDPEPKALFCARGGYGSLRLLDKIDYATARAHPKLLVGYSDVTALQLALYAKAGWPSLSGPMVAVEWPDPDAESERLFWELAEGKTPQPLLGPGGEALSPERPGTAEGVLLGGNLSVLTRLIGTPYLPMLDGAILFLEDVGEAPYRIDGMLAQLRLAGVLDALGGLVLGRFSGWEEAAAGAPTLALEEMLRGYIEELACPVASGLAYGHVARKATVPIGVRARLTVTEGDAALSILEPVVSPT